MKFTCSQQALNKALNTVSKAVSIRSTIPILKGILLKTEGSTLTLTASNIDMSIETKTEIQSSEDGSCVVNAKLFCEIVRRLPNAMITISSDERFNLDVYCLGSEFKIVTMPAEEYPAVGFVEEGKIAIADIKSFDELVRKTSFAASIDEKKGILVGTLINLNSDSIEMVALDGFRMAIANAPAQCGIDTKIVIPSRILSDISKLLSESENSEDVMIKIDDKKVQFAFDNTRIISRQLEGEFIKYSNILPKEYKTRFIIDRSEMINSIERASLFAKEGKNNLIKMTVGNDKVVINSRSEEGNINENIAAEISGEDIVIGFNSKYIIDVLKAVDDEQVAFEMTNSVSSSLIKPVDNTSFTYLVLPVRIASVS